MFTKRRDALLKQITKFLGFLIGICGALAILGIFFKVLQLAHYKTFMYLGFIGEAVAFVLMGLLELGQALFMDPSEEAASDSQPQRAGHQGGSASARRMVEKKVHENLNEMMGSLGEEVKQFGGEINGMTKEMRQARIAVANMRSTIEEISNGQLAENAERLAEEMSSLDEEVERAGTAVEKMRRGLDQMLARIHRFNDSPPGTNGVAEKSAQSREEAVHSQDSQKPRWAKGPMDI